ncbi:nucleoside-binding protein [Fictibacillus solisalsi]|uniref:Nucleoside-binding protein n=1 Tax=Fictibacillus solisalsi TaxID=459525 RepID=A0A1G9YP33_9BACL|nr:BMP family ABC transporter substrate-binding protein [Fictibacillus solisalsi]SDN10351.1 nucleoside-binding protein [Fictibacillus solisalsi]
MKKHIHIFLGVLLLTTTLLSGCGPQETNPVDDKTKIGIMLSDVGLGDQSFSDAGFNGLEKARDRLDIVFEYRELNDSKTYEKGLTELAESGNDLIIGLGFMVQEDLEKVAKKYPEKQFLLVDSVSDVNNVTSLTFKEDEGSYLAGVIAALTTKNKTVGFVGGENAPLIQKFSKGFTEGVKSIDPSIKVLKEYAGDFGNDKLGEKIAQDMIAKKSDVLYAAAGFTGVGVLKKAEQEGVYAIGVDSDQFFYAEKAIITSMVKNVDSALYDVVKEFKQTKTIKNKHIELGLAEKGVGLATIRLVSLSDKQQAKLKEAEQKIIHHKVSFTN